MNRTKINDKKHSERKLFRKNFMKKFILFSLLLLSSISLTQQYEWVSKLHTVYDNVREILSNNSNIVSETTVCIDGIEYIRKTISFYNTKFSGGLGHSSIFFNSDGAIVGFYDYYNFNPSSHRSLWNEIKTTLVRKFSPLLQNPTIYILVYIKTPIS